MASVAPMSSYAPRRDQGFASFTGLRSGGSTPLRAARPAAARPAARPMAVAAAAKPTPKSVLMLGGTRFIGQYLARMLVEQGHEVTLLTRGKAPVTKQIPDDTDASYAAYKSAVRHIACDRTNVEAMAAALGGKKFDAVYDINGREASDALPVLESLPGLAQYVFCSSAGVYLKSDLMPHCESDAVDPKSRHKGKLDTETLLAARGVNYTSVRPVYIYGPLNYNPVEEWFFHRIEAGRPIPVPGSGKQITQLGHVKDLAVAFTKMLANPVCKGQTYNISGEKYVTFDGIANACAKAAGAPAPKLVHYDPKDIDFGKKKGFPMRDQHFFCSIEKAMADLDWRPEFDLLSGLKDSYDKDFGRGGFREAADFSTDDLVLDAMKVHA